MKKLLCLLLCVFSLVGCTGSDASKFKNFLGDLGHLKSFYAIIKEYTGLGSR